jgi:hypothetical protein
MKFKCFDCNNVFEAKGKKKEYIDPIYGPCSKWVSSCPDCKSEISEYNPSLGKNNRSTQTPSCGVEGGCSSCRFNH